MCPGEGSTAHVPAPSAVVTRQRWSLPILPPTAWGAVGRKMRSPLTLSEGDLPHPWRARQGGKS
eukprot:12134157-Heterocapsa_arctica.AAC.1